MILVLISDTHNRHKKVEVPPGDVLVFAGDFSTHESRGQLKDFAKWFLAQPHTHKIVIAGNHDILLEKQPEAAAIFEGAHYLFDSGVTIEGVNFWGSPYTPEFMNWAFNVPRGKLHRHWDKIPDNTDVLVTHGPPFGILDQAKIAPGWEHLGDEELRAAVERGKPKLHVFGHIHGSQGIAKIGDTIFVNASVVDEAYNLYNREIITVDI